MPTRQKNLSIFRMDTQTHTYTHILSFRLAGVSLSILKYQILSQITKHYIFSLTLMLNLIKEKYKNLGFHYIRLYLLHVF